MDITIPITQLRAHLGSLLKRLREDPNIVFRITHHGEVVAHLKAPGPDTGVATEMCKREVADFIAAYLQGVQPRNKSTYADLRLLSAVSSSDLPHDNLEDAMKAIRGRANGVD